MHIKSERIKNKSCHCLISVRAISPSSHLSRLIPGESFLYIPHLILGLGRRLCVCKTNATLDVASIILHIFSLKLCFLCSTGHRQIKVLKPAFLCNINMAFKTVFCYDFFYQVLWCGWAFWNWKTFSEMYISILVLKGKKVFFFFFFFQKALTNHLFVGNWFIDLQVFEMVEC